MRLLRNPILALFANPSFSTTTSSSTTTGVGAAIFGLLSNMDPTPAASTTTTLPTPANTEFNPLAHSAWPSPGRPIHRPTGIPLDGPESPDDFHEYIAGRFCPWCWMNVNPSESVDECNFFIQQSSGSVEEPDQDVEPMAWAVLDYNFSRVLAAGVARRDESVPVTLSDVAGGGYVQYTENRFEVSSRKGTLAPLFVFNGQNFEPTSDQWQTYPFVGDDGRATAKRVSFSCSREVPCELGGRCGDEVSSKGEL